MPPGLGGPAGLAARDASGYSLPVPTAARREEEGAMTLRRKLIWISVLYFAEGLPFARRAVKRDEHDWSGSRH